MQAPDQIDSNVISCRKDAESRCSTIILVGSTIRSAAQSAARGGYRVVGFDQFGDRDAKDACVEFALMNDIEHVSELLGRHDSAPIVQVSGLSNLANWTRKHPSIGPRLSPCLEVQQAIADPNVLQSIALESGFHFPPTFDYAGDVNRSNDQTGRWLLKPKDGSGGLGIRWHVSRDQCDDATTDASHEWIQRWIPGRTFGATLILRKSTSIAGENKVVLLGICRAMFHQMRMGNQVFPFVYSGSFGPLPCPANLAESLTRMGHEIIATTGLHGLCNVDFVIDRQGTPWLLEINPRWSGSSELIERQLQERGEIKAGLSLFSVAHLGTPQPLQGPGSIGGTYLKKVVFAPVAFRFCLDHVKQVCSSQVELLDLPTEGGTVEVGMPVLSLIARVDGDVSYTLRSMRHIVRSIRDVARRELHSPFSSANDLIR